MFLFVYNPCPESAMLHSCVSTVGQSRQTKHRLGPYMFFHNIFFFFFFLNEAALFSVFIGLNHWVHLVWREGDLCG